MVVEINQEVCDPIFSIMSNPWLYEHEVIEYQSADDNLRLAQRNRWFTFRVIVICICDGKSDFRDRGPLCENRLHCRVQLIG